VNRAERRAQMRNRFCRGGPPPPVYRPGSVANDGRPQRAAPTNASLHIHELVLHGFPVQKRHAIGDAVQLELMRQLNTLGLPKFVTSEGQSEAIDGGTLHATSQTRPNQLGKLIAKAVYGGRRR